MLSSLRSTKSIFQQKSARRLLPEAVLRIPERVEITVAVGGRPTMGMFVMLKFGAARKNSYNLLFGPSDERGKIEVSRDQILHEAKKTANLFLMDYGGIEIEWTGALGVTPMNRQALAGALAAHKLFKSSYECASGYEKALKAAEAILSQEGDVEMNATVQCETKEPVTMEIVAVRAG